MKMLHVYSFHTPSLDSDKKRLQVAAYTWKSQGWKEMPIMDSELSRLFTEPPRKTLPFVRDVIDKGAEGLLYEDIIVFTNSDTAVSTDCAKKIKARLKKVPALYCFRRDFDPFMEPIPDTEISKGSTMGGSDLYAFTVEWWKANRKKFPVMILAREGWKDILRVIIDESGQYPDTKLENVIYHAKHEAYWEKPEIRHSLAGNIFNYERALPFLAERKIDPKRFGFK